MNTAEVELRHSHVQVENSSLHVVETGDGAARPVLFLHGWPESWRAWQTLMELASTSVRAIAVDLPGVGASTGATTDGSKQQLAQLVHKLIVIMAAISNTRSARRPTTTPTTVR